MNNPLQLLALTLFTAITFSSTALSAGKLYKWVDDKG